MASTWSRPCLHTRHTRAVAAKKMDLMTSTAEIRALLSRPVPRTLTEAVERLIEVEEKLRESEDRAKATFEQAAVGIAHQTLDYQWLWVNQAWCDIAGYPREELLGMTLEQLTHPDDREASIDFANRVRAGELPDYSIEKRYIRKDGSIVWVHLTVSMVHPPSGAEPYLVGFLQDITDRKNAELALEHSVSELRATLESTADAIVVVRNDRVITSYNQHLVDMFKIPDEIMASRSAGDAFAHLLEQVRDPDRVRATVHELFTTPEAESYDVFELLDGRVLERYSKPQRVGGVGVGRVWSFRDVTDRRHAEEELRESEERWRRLTTVAVEGVLIHDHGVLIDANPSFARMFGYEPEELVGRNVLEFLPAPEWRDVLKRNVEIGFEQPFEAVGLRKDGTRVALEIVGRATTHHGRGVRVTSVRDITERKRLAEQELEIVREQAARAEAVATASRAAFLAEASRVLAGSFDYETTLASLARLAVPTLADHCSVDVQVSEGVFSRVGVAHIDPAKMEFVRKLADYAFVPRLEAHPIVRALTEGVPVLVPEMSSEMLDASASSPEHRELLRQLGPRSLIAVPLMSSTGVLGALTLVISESDRRYGPDDLTLAQELAQRAALAVENARLYIHAQQATQARDDMLSIVAHDLRNPLGTIIMATELLQEMFAEETARGSKQIDMVRRAASRMNRLIQDLLDVRRIESGGLALERRAEYVKPVVADAVEMLRPLARAAALGLEDIVPDDLPPCYVDPARIQQVLSNLVGNAIKFTPKGGCVTIRAQRETEKEVRVAVSDTGPGIPPDQIPHIFGRFWQGQRTDRRGVGLGLAIVKGIVEAHEGRVWVESRLGVGSDFIFTMPVAQPSAGGSREATTG